MYDFREMATQEFGYGYVQACALLGIECPLRPGVPPCVIQSHASGRGYPTAVGLYSMPAAGLLHPGDGEAAYKQAFEEAVADFGRYAISQIP